MVFECNQLHGVRGRFHNLFSEVTFGDLRSFTNQQPCAAVGVFLIESYERIGVLDTEQPSQAGGEM